MPCIGKVVRIISRTWKTLQKHYTSSSLLQNGALKVYSGRQPTKDYRKQLAFPRAEPGRSPGFCLQYFSQVLDPFGSMVGRSQPTSLETIASAPWISPPWTDGRKLERWGQLYKVHLRWCHLILHACLGQGLCRGLRELNRARTRKPVAVGSWSGKASRDPGDKQEFLHQIHNMSHNRVEKTHTFGQHQGMH